jgi:hypothetical protein
VFAEDFPSRPRKAVQTVKIRLLHRIGVIAEALSKLPVAAGLGRSPMTSWQRVEQYDSAGEPITDDVCSVRFDAAACSLRFEIAARTFLDRKIIQETRFRA